jgi:hypothetical protein
VTEARGEYVTTGRLPVVSPPCPVCGVDLAPEEVFAGLCYFCQQWPAPVIDAHLHADNEDRERVKVRLIAVGNNQFEFRMCRVRGDWVEVEDTKHGMAFWVALRHVVTVWEERV